MCTFEICQTSGSIVLYIGTVVAHRLGIESKRSVNTDVLKIASQHACSFALLKAIPYILYFLDEHRKRASYAQTYTY